MSSSTRWISLPIPILPILSPISIDGYQHIGTLPERRKNPARITQESVINWVRKILDENIDFNDVFFITIMIDKNSGDILRFSGEILRFKD
jgi:hypothetical protein